VPSLERITENWRRSVVQADAAVRLLAPGCCHTLRYEDLLADPDAAGRRLLAFFGLAPSAAYSTALEAVVPQGDWRRDLSEAEVAAVETAPGVRAVLEAHGYSPQACEGPRLDTVDDWVVKARSAPSPQAARQAWLRVLRLHAGHLEASAALQAEPKRGEALFGLLHDAPAAESGAASARLEALLRARGLDAAAAAAVAGRSS
jgi:hypothetical protein